LRVVSGYIHQRCSGRLSTAFGTSRSYRGASIPPSGMAAHRKYLSAVKSIFKLDEYRLLRRFSFKGVTFSYPYPALFKTNLRGFVSLSMRSSMGSPWTVFLTSLAEAARRNDTCRITSLSLRRKYLHLIQCVLMRGSLKGLQDQKANIKYHYGRIGRNGGSRGSSAGFGLFLSSEVSSANFIEYLPP
jgi:hypothetical protein